MNCKHFGIPPLRSYLTAGMEATRKEKHAMMDNAMQLYVNWVQNDMQTRAENKYIW